MDRREAMLRELNLYPQWQRRGNGAAVGHPAVSPLPGQSRDGAVVGQAVLRVEEPAPVAASPEVSTPASALAEPGWAELKQRVRDCQLCPLRAGCTQTVFGSGDENADWLFVGEAPGADEDALGAPFVGQSGRLLDNMLAAIRLKRGSNVYIANVIKCRTPEDRHPHVGEIAHCLPYLHRQIGLIQPKVIVALGKTAATALLGQDAPLASLRGTVHDYQKIPLIVTYHPAYLLRSPLEKAKAWEDLCLAAKTI